MIEYEKNLNNSEERCAKLAACNAKYGNAMYTIEYLTNREDRETIIKSVVLAFAINK